MKLKTLLFISSCLFINCLSAQNLLVNGDFESGGNGVGFIVDGTGYTQINIPFSGTTAPGDYAFTTNPQPMNTALFIAGGDHTSGTGNMMIIDGNSAGGSQSFWIAGDTGAGVCSLLPDVTYIFSFWIKSVSTDVTDTASSADIGVQFINASDIVGPSSTLAPLPADGWQKVTYTFKATQPCVKIVLANNNTNVVGNDFAVDDFSVSASLPTATVSGTAGACLNGASPDITFTGSDGTAPYTFTYNINGGADQTVTTTTGDSVTVAAPTTVAGTFDYNLVSVAYGATPVFSQNQAGTATITVYAPPTATISGNGEACFGDTVLPEVTFTALGGTAPYTFTYNINGSGVYTVTTTSGNSVTVAVPTSAIAVYNYNLISVSSADIPCGQNQSGTVTVKIDPLPFATMSGTVVVCRDSTSPKITFTGVNGTPPYTFVYNINGAPNQTVTTTPTSTNVKIDAPTDVAGIFDYNLISVSSGSVAACSSPMSLTTTITVNDLPTATISGDANVCLNAVNPVITFTGANGTAPYTFTYNINDGVSQTITTTSGDSVTLTVPTTVAGYFVYNLTAVSSATTPSCSQEITETKAAVAVGAAATITAPLASICPGFSVVLTFNGTPNTIVNFTSPDGTQSVLLDADGHGTFTPFVLSTTTFTLTSANNNTSGCAATLTQSATVYVGQCCEFPEAEVEIQMPAAVCNAGDCTDLTASYFMTKPTTDYKVIPLCYQTLYDYLGGTPLSANCDDVWSPTFTLPFNFCFYGNTYSQLLIGSNGVMTFNLSGWGSGCTTPIPLDYCPWNYSGTIPNTSFPIKNAIYGVYQDTDIGSGVVTNPATQMVNYHVGGTAPNRFFVCSFNELPQFQCHASVGLQTSQIILHETTNIIDVYVKKRTSCTSWSNPNGMVGVQNSAGTKATAAPGRNSGTWSTTNEAWRFYPAGTGPDSVDVKWTDSDGNTISTANNIKVCPTSPETYTAEVTYHTCNNTDIVKTDEITVNIEQPFTLNDPGDITLCNSTGAPFNFDIDQSTAILNGNSPTDYEVLYYEDEQDAKDWAGNNIVDLANYQVNTQSELPKTIYVRITDLSSGSNCANYKSFVLDAFVPGGTISYPEGPFCGASSASVSVTNSPDLPFGGKYVASPDGLSIDENTGTILPGSSLKGITYTVVYTIEAGACPEFNTPPVTITINACPETTIDPHSAVCASTSFDLTTSDAGFGAIYTWSDADGVELPTSPTTSPTINVTAPTLSGSYTYTVVAAIGVETSLPSSTTVVINPIPQAIISGPTSICMNASTSVVFSGTPGAYVTYSDGSGDPNPTIHLNNDTPVGTYTLTTPPITSATTYQIVSVYGDYIPSCQQDILPSAPNSNLTINVGAPEAVITNVSEAEICAGSVSSITIEGTPGGSVNYTVTDAGGTVSQGPVILDASGVGTIATGNLAAGTTTYTLTDITTGGASGCSANLSGASVTASVVVNALPTASFSAASATVCEGAAGTLDFIGTPGATVNYTDSLANYSTLLDTSGASSVTTGALISCTTYTLVDVTSDTTVACTQLLSATATICIDLLPGITDQPTGTTVCNGQSVTFTVAATGTDIHYQWKYNDTTDIGTDQPSFTITSPVDTDAGNYSVVVSNTCGTVTSDAAVLTVNQPTIITDQPIGQTVCEGQPIHLSISATGINLSYQWYNGTTLIAGATNPVLDIAAAVLADAGSYTCQVVNPCQTVTSSAATVVVNQLPAIVSQPTGTTICTGESFTLIVGATGTGLSYEWYLEGVPVDATLNPTAATSSLNVSSAVLSDAGNYTVIVSGLCLPSVTSIAAEVVVNQAPAITDQPDSVTVCAGQAISLSVTATGSNLAYQWYNGTTPITGATSTTYSISATVVGDSGSYSCHVSNSSAICPAVISEAAIVVINESPAIVTQPASNIYCLGDPIVLTVSATGNNITYQWQFNNGDIDLATGNTYTIAVSQISDSGDYTCIVSSASCPSITSAVAHIVVRPLPEATIANGPESAICAGHSSEIIFNGTPDAVVTYTINGDTGHTITLNPSGEAIFGTGTLIATTQYDLVSVSTNGTPSCSNSAVGSAVVTVNPIPDVQLPQDAFICVTSSGVVLAPYRFETGLGASFYTFQWYLDDVAIVDAIQPYYEASVTGTYKVLVTNSSTGCFLAVQAPLVSSIPPVSVTAEVVTNYFDEDATIVVTVDPPGDYEYRIDDGPYQQSNIFSNVDTILSHNQTGVHTVYARDLKACGEQSYSVTIIDYPKYFTPNGDGFHETWNISTLSNQPNAKIYIFDRYGKLLKQISTTGPGWDGIFNGQPMLADDYWFVVKYLEAGINKEFKAHFSLKR